MRPIDADALLQRWNNLLPRMARDKDGAVPIDFCLAIHEVSATPTLTLDDLRAKGRWKRCVSEHYVECSECKQGMYIHSIAYSFRNFCPNCGAKMDGGDTQ